jgi:O-antigen/teichoic acid export membrane protein
VPSAVRRSIPVRTFSDWHDPPPGFFEADLVAHSGPKASGSFVQTLVLTDIVTGWTNARRCWSRYLRAIEYITAIQWPVLILLMLLAHPIVEILLGRQWLDVAPILQIFAGVCLFNFPVGLVYPTLVAVGAVRFLPAIVLTQIIVSAGLWWFIAASYGRYGAAIGTLVSVPIEVFISTLVVRYQVRFSYGELARISQRG